MRILLALLLFISFSDISLAGICTANNPCCSGPGCSEVDAGQGCRLGAGTCRIWGQDNICKDISNASGLPLYIPLKIPANTAEDNWIMFYNNAPTNVPGVTVADCTYPCNAVTGQTWTVSTLTCAADLPSTPDGGTSTISDTTGPDTGSSSWFCNNGTWQLQAGATCDTTSAPCGTATLNWGTSPACSASFAGVAHNATSSADDTTGPDTGSATYLCNNGTWQLQSGSCSSTSNSCSTQTLTWTKNGYSCSASIGGVAHGSTSSGTDSTGPETGSATYSCDNGSWLLTATYDCIYTPQDCTGAAQSWVSGGDTCNASTGNLLHGSNTTISDADTGTNGSAIYHCCDGTWILEQTTESCYAACPSSTPTWTVSGNSCSGSLAGTTHGNNSSASSSSPSGTATYTCSDGSWVLNSGATCESTASTPCPATTVTWLTYCTGSLPESTGDPAIIQDTSNGHTGTGSYFCNSDGTWTLDSGTCYAACTFNSTEVLHGASVTAYQVSSGSTCPSETRTCSDGVLSGSYAYASCTVDSTSGGGGGCFVAGTKVTMADGSYKNIEEIVVGEWVKTYDEVTGAYTISPVKKALYHEANRQVILTFMLEDGTEVTSNDNHPMYVVEQANYSMSGRLYERYSRGEQVTFYNERGQEVRVVNILRTEKITAVYNLHVSSPYDTVMVDSENGHNYFANGVLVHNQTSTETVKQ